MKFPFVFRFEFEALEKRIKKLEDAAIIAKCNKVCMPELPKKTKRKKGDK